MTTDATPPPAHEQVIEQRLVACGLRRGGFTVKYEDYLQSIEIVITPAAGAREDHFPCIQQAVGHEIVSFADGSMQRGYSRFQSEFLRPRMLERATAELKKRGLLANFPERRSYASLDLYAEALEQHSGMVSGSTLKVSDMAIVFDPPKTDLTFRDFDKRYASLMAVLVFASARGDAAFGFIGNEALAAPQGKH